MQFLRTILVLAVILGLSSESLANVSRKRKTLCTKVMDFSNSETFYVQGVYAPKTIDELREIITRTKLRVSVKGGGFSQGGQTIAQDGIVIDMQNLNKVVEYNPAEKSLRIQAGATWRQVQELIFKDGLAVQVMQSYNNFHIGGALSVNAHGRYNGFGPIVSTVREIKLMLSDGKVVTASREENPELFSAAIGGYGAVGIILEAKLDLATNHKLERKSFEFSGVTLGDAVKKAIQHHEQEIAKSGKTVMFNADIIPPTYDKVRTIVYDQTDKPVTVLEHLQPPPPTGFRGLIRAAAVSLEQLVDRVKKYRGTVIVPRDLEEERVVYQNWEASYDVNELKPLSEKFPWLKKTFSFSNKKALLQEYFIPKSRLPEFVETMRTIFEKYDVNVSNISLRDVPRNNDSMLSWAKEDSFAVVIYYTQTYGRKPEKSIAKAKAWTREMIDEIIKVGGSFYLPYQVYASADQFRAAYPRADEFFKTRKTYDPNKKFSNNLWRNYDLAGNTYHYRDFMANDASRIELRRFFQNVFSQYDSLKYLEAIDKALKNIQDAGKDPHDRAVYEELLAVLPAYSAGKVKDMWNTNSALRKQQAEMVNQTAHILGNLGVTKIDGMLEIGSPGRYVAPLKARLPIEGKIYSQNDPMPRRFSPANMFERSGGYGFLDPRSWLAAFRGGKMLDLTGYDPIPAWEVPNQSVDLVTIYIGLHHCPPAKLHDFVASLYRLLRPGGKIILRDHNATPEMIAMVFLAHSTYNAGLGYTFASERGEIRNFQPLSYWKKLLEDTGFIDHNFAVLQEGDPTANTLMAFSKPLTPEDAVARIKERIAQEPESRDKLLKLIPGYHRPSTNTYMTQPEWLSVQIFRDFANFMAHTPWFKFPFREYIKLYDEAFDRHRDYVERKGVSNFKAYENYLNMDRFLSIGIKYLFKQLAFFADIVTKFQKDDVQDLKTKFLVEMSKDQFEGLPQGVMELLAELPESSYLFQTDRYMPFTPAMIQLARMGVKVLEVAGEKELSILFETRESSMPKLTTPHEHIMDYKLPIAHMPNGEGGYRHTISVHANNLSPLLVELLEGGHNIVSIHDF